MNCPTCSQRITIIGSRTFHRNAIKAAECRIQAGQLEDAEGHIVECDRCGGQRVRTGRPEGGYHWTHVNALDGSYCKSFGRGGSLNPPRPIHTAVRV